MDKHSLLYSILYHCEIYEIIFVCIILHSLASPD